MLTETDYYYLIELKTINNYKQTIMSTKKNTTVKNTNTQLAVNTAKTASEAILALEQKLASFETVSMTPFKTGGKVTLPVAGSSVKLDECSDTELLIRAAGNIKLNEEVYTTGAKAMNLNKYKAFNHAGYSAADWLHDINLRYAIVNQHDAETQVRNQIKNLKQFVSKDEQFAMALQEAASVIANLG